MDTVTRAAMAIVLAEEGGIGVIDRGFRAGDIAPQVAEVAAVKRTQHGIIADPHTIASDAAVADALRAHGADRRRHAGGGRRDTPADGPADRARRAVRAGATSRVADRMTPRARLVVHTGAVSLAEAERLMTAHKIKKLPLVNADGTLLGLITAKDLLKHQQHPFATRDEQGRLRVGGGGRRDGRLPRAGGRSPAGGRRRARHRHRARPFAGDGARDRADPRSGSAASTWSPETWRPPRARGFCSIAASNAIKVGIGPGGGCTTRLTTNFGVPQVEALVQCRLAVGDARADHRRRRHPAATAASRRRCCSAATP